MNIIAFKKRSLSYVLLLSACSALYADNQSNTNPACPYPQSVVEKDSLNYFSGNKTGSSLVAASKHEKNMDIYRSLCGPSPKVLLNEQILQIMEKSYPNYFAVEPLLVKNENIPFKTTGPTSGQPAKQLPYNPICQNSEQQVEMDSINHFNKKYPDSSVNQNNMHKQNMETYKKVCSSPLKERLGESTIDLINSSYPDYAVMLGVLDKEVDAIKELQKYIQKAPSLSKEQKPAPKNTNQVKADQANNNEQWKVARFYKSSSSYIKIVIETDRKRNMKCALYDKKENALVTDTGAVTAPVDTMIISVPSGIESVHSAKCWSTD